MSYNLSLAESLKNIETTYEVMVKDLFGDQMPGNYGLYAETMPCKNKTLELDWLGDLPLMREWVGPRVYEYVRAYLYSMTFAKHEATLPIDRTDIEYGSSGAVSKRLANFLAAQAQYYDLKAMAKLISNPTGYDGVSLFSASHPHAKDAGTNSNYSTNSLTRASYEAARIVMQSYTTEKGRNWMCKPTTAIVGPTLEAKAKEIWECKDRKVVVDSTGTEATGFNVAATSIDNIWAGELDVVIDPNLTGSYAYYWYLLDTSKPGVKPVIIMENRKMQSINQTAMDDDRRFEHDQFVFGIEGDFSFAAGFWPVAYGNLATE